MKVLICAASKYGATSEIARAVADVLAGRGCEVTVLPPQEAGAVEEFDAVVLGSAVYMGQWMNPRGSWPSVRPPRWSPGRSGRFPAARSASRPAFVTSAVGAGSHQLTVGPVPGSAAAASRAPVPAPHDAATLPDPNR